MNYQSAIDGCVRSEPLAVYWLGFRSDTFALQKNGWSMVVEMEHDYYQRQQKMRFKMKHARNQLVAISDVIAVEEVIDHWDGSRRRYLHEMVRHGHYGLSLQFLAPNVYVDLEKIGVDRCFAINEEPLAPWPSTARDYNLRQFPLFDVLAQGDARMIPEPPQIITMSDQLQAILDEQADKQDEIRDRIRREERRIERVRAEIITVAA